MNQNKPLTILFLEDSEFDLEVMVRSLKKSGLQFDFEAVSNIPAFTEKLLLVNPTIVIADYNLPSATALDALFEVKRYALKVPFIVVSAYLGDEKTVETLKAGVTDIVSKSKLEHLPFAITRALEETKIRKEKEEAERELKLSKERLELAIYGGDIGTWDLDTNTFEIVYNPKARKILFIEDLPEKLKFNYFLPREGKHNKQFVDIKKAMDNCLEGSSKFFEYELSFMSPDYTEIWVSIAGKIITRGQSNESLRMSGTIKDVTAKKKNEDELVRNKTLLEEAEKMGVVGSYDWDVKNDKFFSSNGFRNILDFHSLEPDHVDYFSNIHPSDRRIFEEVLKRKNNYFSVEHRIMMPDGHIKPIRSSGKIICDENGKISNIFGLIQDITEQRALKSAIFKGQDNERQRIAREIHDGIGQMLVAAKYRLMSMKPDNYSESVIKDTEDLIDLILEESRRITKNLTAKIVEEHGLVKAVTFLIEDLKNTTGIQVEYNIASVPGLSLDLSNSMYRIIQEALNNVVKYAEASLIKLSLQKENEYLNIEIIDNGVGFVTEKSSEGQGNGLKNMKERALLYNGVLEVISSIGHGTTIKCIVPVAENL